MELSSLRIVGILIPFLKLFKGIFICILFVQRMFAEIVAQLTDVIIEVRHETKIK